MLQLVLKALLQDRKAAETPKAAKAAKFSSSIRAWARLKALVLLILLLCSFPGVRCHLPLMCHCIVTMSGRPQFGIY